MCCYGKLLIEMHKKNPRGNGINAHHSINVGRKNFETIVPAAIDD